MRGVIGRWISRAGSEDPAGAPSPRGPLTARGLHPLVARVLTARGITDDLAAERFLDPRLKDLHDPSLMPDLDRAAARLLAALAAREPIVVYGDYDVDGVTATAILSRTLRAIDPAAPVSTYIPHRVDEGYGLNAAAVEELAAQGARVIVSVDCGVTAVGPAIMARERGVDLIITDHHHPPDREEDLPAAFAVVHPARPGSAYPFADLCGAGVAYKLAWRLATLSGQGASGRGGGVEGGAGGEAGAGTGARATPALRRLLLDLLPLCALGVVADVVPLVGENRVIAKFGLGGIKHSPFVGLRALVEASGLAGEKVDAMDVGFKLAPRLNASGRMGHAKDALELFTTADPARAAELALFLTAQNEQRKGVERAILAQATEMAEGAGMTAEDRRAIVLAHEEWHSGVVGIVCSRLVERYCRPTILMQTKDGICHGSGRSVDGFDLHAALESCAPLLLKFGGHTMAAGLTLEAKNLPAFVEAFTTAANAAIGTDDLCRTLSYDCEALLSELTVEAVQGLEVFAPFGRDNPDVRLLVRNVRITATPRQLGQSNRHIAFHVGPGGATRPPSAGGTVAGTPMPGLLRIVAWGWGDRIDELAAGSTVDLVIEPKICSWNGRVTVEPVLQDVRPSGGE